MLANVPATRDAHTHLLCAIPIARRHLYQPAPSHAAGAGAAAAAEVTKQWSTCEGWTCAAR